MAVIDTSISHAPVMNSLYYCSYTLTLLTTAAQLVYLFHTL